MNSSAADLYLVFVSVMWVYETDLIDDALERH